MNIDLLTSDLQRDEGWRAAAYDDATGAPIRPGYTVKGHVTVGYGFALDVAPMTQVEAMPILRGRAQDAYDTMVKAEPWIADLPEPCQRAIGNMSYNLGPTKLLGFGTFLGYMRQGQFAAAADSLVSTKWYGQVGNRAARICALIKGAMA